MDDLLQAELEALCARHQLPLSVAAELVGLLDKMLDSRFLSWHDEAAETPPAPPTPLPVSGVRVPEDLEDLGLLGRGRMGEVRQVRDHSLQRVVALKRLIEPRAAAWFAREMRILASLEHPGVVPIFRAGTLRDGTPWFTMRQIQGRTLAEALSEEDAARWPLRRRIEILRRVADTLGYAHERGIIHRDLKPANILLGHRGEVMLADWGLALEVGAGAGQTAGTPAYMAPEQQHGAPAAPQADVWSLGQVLVEVLTGALPAPDRTPQELLQGRAPAELIQLVLGCLHPDPAARLPSGTAVSQALGDWLDGVRREEEARAALARALALRAEADVLRRESQRIAEEAASQLSALEPWQPEADKRPAWALEDQAAAMELEALVKEEAHLEELGIARERAPLPEVQEALADWHYARFLEALLSHQPARIATARRRLEAVAPLRLRAWEDATGTLTLHTEPQGARVVARPFVLEGRRLVPGPPQELGQTPLQAHPLPAGSWLLELDAPGRAPVRYPVQIARFEHWDGVPPGESAPHPVYLPRPEELGPEDCYVPAGWCWLGAVGMPNTRPPGAYWVDGFVMRRYVLRNGELLALLDQLVAEGQTEAALAMVPRERASGQGAGACIYAFDGEHFTLKPDADGDLWHADEPVIMITHPEASAICAAYARRDGLPWRLPASAELEKASRGTDGRLYGWGSHYDHSFSCRSRSRPGRPLPCSVYDFPIDESPYGVRGTFGLVRGWTSERVPDQDAETYYVQGSYYNAHGDGNVATRFHTLAVSRGVSCGVRLTRSLTKPAP